ncbi:aldehyde dehydrogenase family protein [Nocardioides sp. Iso805N]|uniref:aldehyde dehydrogenase family protein n=1 Tax=Nocardioides sp. Iso805N TaxID=1283287 RepID=UPI00035D2CAF|nr:aldehyde dehydrogenase family protein [Nocardioides sp. Iso805N]
MADRSTIPARALIDGQMVGAAATFDVVAPATGEVIASLPDCGPAELDRAVEAARRAQPVWAGDEEARRTALRRLADLIEAHEKELAEIVAVETGHPAMAGGFEARGAAHHVRWVADAEVPTYELPDASGARTVAEHVPVGVAAAIVPWNAPLVMAAHKLAAAVRVGNTIVLKPSPFTPLATLRLGELVAEALPAGVVNILPGGDELGRAITSHPGIDLISFTGSVETGKAIMAAAAPTLKRVTLELGGNDAAIVLDDADPDVVAEPLFRSAFMLSGQVCQAIKRLYVHRSKYDAVVERLAAIASAVVVGAPFEPDVAVGPLTTAAQRDRVEELVEDARAHGGQIRAGGHRLDRPGCFYAPTIVTGLSDSDRLVAEEQFGPALPVLVYDDLEDAITRANGTPYGLSASVWTSDPARGEEVGRRLVGGSVWINKHAGVDPGIPFGGMRQSGIGRESGLAGLLGFTELRTVTVPAAESTTESVA